jgi:hypothetical protein
MGSFHTACWTHPFGRKEEKVLSPDSHFPPSLPPLNLHVVGKVFPKLKRKGSSRFREGVAEVPEEPVADPNAADFVFRIVYPNYTRSNFCQATLTSKFAGG